MTDQDIIEIIAQGIVDGTDMDCTPMGQARAVLKALRDEGVLPTSAILMQVRSDAFYRAAQIAFDGVPEQSTRLNNWAEKLNGRGSASYRIARTVRDTKMSIFDKIMNARNKSAEMPEPPQ